MEFWLKNTAGQKSASLTFVTIAFLVVTLWLLVSIINITHIRPFDAGAAMQYLVPLLMLYFGRRYSDSKTTGAIDTNAGDVTVAAQPEETSSSST